MKQSVSILLVTQIGLRSSTTLPVQSLLAIKLYKELGRMEDPEKAICEALSLRPPGHPNRFASFNNLANAVLGSWVGWRYNREVLSLSPSGYHEALGLDPPGHPDRPASLNNLASAVLTRYKQSGKMEDLEVIAYNREALSLCPPDYPDRSRSLINLGNAPFSHYRQSGRIEDLEEMITY